MGLFLSDMRIAVTALATALRIYASLKKSKDPATRTDYRTTALDRFEFAIGGFDRNKHGHNNPYFFNRYL